MEHILNEAIDNLDIYWLELVASFELENSMDSYLDLSITLKAFQFRSFDKIENTSLPDCDIDQALFSFHLKHMKPQYETWSSKKIIVVKVFGPIETESFINACFKVACGVASSMFEFTLANFPCLNPFDSISLLHLWLIDEQKFEPIVSHIKRMLVSYIHEVNKMKVEIASFLRKKPTILPKEPSNDFEIYEAGKNMKG
ncbi:unnamed protein product [Lactuca saligna]|uniref:Uncharacterized protein n=1 Tax=Lactuca saligna TaxID=75948 RepID=A0AA36A4H2_LACSI|nr:unnamed protein product [Lactuca saligna]